MRKDEGISMTGAGSVDVTKSVMLLPRYENIVSAMVRGWANLENVMKDGISTTFTNIPYETLGQKNVDRIRWKDHKDVTRNYVPPFRILSFPLKYYEVGRCCRRSG